MQVSHQTLVQEYDKLLKQYNALAADHDYLLSQQGELLDSDDRLYELNSNRKLIRLLKVKEGVYSVRFSDTSVSLGQFTYRAMSNIYIYEPPEYWDYTGEWDEDTLIAIGLHLKDLNLECANKAKETRQYD